MNNADADAWLSHCPAAWLHWQHAPQGFPGCRLSCSCEAKSISRKSRSCGHDTLHKLDSVPVLGQGSLEIQQLLLFDLAGQLQLQQRLLQAL